MKRQVLVVGLGRFGSAVARTLHQLGHEVMAIDINSRRVQDMIDEVTHAIQADGSDRDALQEIGIADFDVAVVAITNPIAPSILATMTLRELGIPYIIAKAVDEQHARILGKIGADRVVFPEKETGERVAHTFAARYVIDYMDLGPSYGIAMVKPPEGVIGKTIEEARLRENYQLSLIAVTTGTEVTLNPLRERRIGAKDVLVVGGRDEDLERLSP